MSSILRPLQLVINQYFKLDSHAQGMLIELNDSVIQIQFEGYGIDIFCCVTESSLHLFTECELEPDVMISGSPFNLLALLVTDDHIAALQSVTVKGDMHRLQELKQALDAIEVDWEEHLSKVVGDVLAHQMGKVARSGAVWGHHLLTTLQLNLSEYLQEEAKLLPTRVEVGYFLEEVDAVRSDVDRLIQRVDQLTNFDKDR